MGTSERGTRPFAPWAAGLVALLMILLVFPNPLKVPQDNPTATAEYAPVPGDPQDAENANFGEVGLADSAGIGSGGEGVGLAPAGFDIPPPTQYKPRQKYCVGNPPRQTEDPLSPPCVPFFEGENGGSTYPGVTKEEIKIVLYNDGNTKGDMNQPYKPSDDDNTGGAPAPYQETNLVRTIKAQLRYFQSRYQTYGRRVQVDAQKSSGGLGTNCEQRKGDADETIATFRPFAAVHLGDGAQCYMEHLAKRYETPSFGLNSDVQRHRYENFRPYVWGFFPDQESESAWSASFICRKLFGRPAKFTNDLLLKGNERKFGMVIPQSSGRGPESEQLAKLLRTYMKDECGLEPEIAFFSGGGADKAPTIMSSFKQKGVTTVICYCVPVPTETTVSTMQGAATGINYFPEWYWDHTSRMFRAVWEQTYGDPKHMSFGVSHHWRQPAFRQQQAYRAYVSQQPNTEPNAFLNFDIYHLFLNLFQAIQAAGPELTPESVERGMFTFNYPSRANPMVPTGGYGPYNKAAISPYTFVDTAMGWWWDPTGTPPGGRSGEGCLRLMDQGRRYYPGAWPLGDADLFVGGAPCSPDDRKLAEGGSTF